MNTPATTVIDEDPAHADMWKGLDEATSEVMGNDITFTGTLIDLLNSTPQGRAAIARARARAERSIATPCPWGWCINEYDPVDRMLLAGYGPVGCPCENLPGWRTARPAGRAKPQVPTKARGRHGSRVQRSTARHALPNYDLDDFAWLTPRTTTDHD